MGLVGSKSRWLFDEEQNQNLVRLEEWSVFFLKNHLIEEARAVGPVYSFLLFLSGLEVIYLFTHTVQYLFGYGSNTVNIHGPWLVHGDR